MRRTIVTTCTLAFVGCLVVFSGCAVDSTDDDENADAAEGEDDENVGETSQDLVSSGPCAGKAIDRAVKCAKAKGARVLSYYRSPADQKRVRRENGCRDACHGQAGCVRPTADCTTSPHTACRAVDLVADGAPATRAQLRACGLAKTTAPHKNHYDLVN